MTDQRAGMLLTQVSIPGEWKRRQNGDMILTVIPSGTAQRAGT